MKAFVFDRYGQSGELHLADVNKPSPRHNQVLVKVHAVSVNDWDWGILQGTPFVNRVFVGLIKPKKPMILGCDIAGQVEAVGRAIKKFQPGDEVYGDLSSCGFGGLAEYVCVPENALETKPASMSFVDAAAIPQAAILALQALYDKGALQPGQRLLINGAGGGVGTYGLQIAKSIGAEVTVVDTAMKLDMLSSLGADHVIDYTVEDFTRNGQCYDHIVDTKTNRPPYAYVRSLAPSGIYATVGGTMPRLFQIFALGKWVSKTRNRHIHVIGLKPNKGLDQINVLFEAGKLKSIIDGPYAFNETREAFRHFGEAQHMGKVVIAVMPT